MEDNFLAIVVPVYNAESTVRRTLESLCNKITHSNLNGVRVYVADDASTDSSLTTIIEFAKEYDFVHYYCCSERFSIGYVRNILMSQAVADDFKYVAFCDADDIMNVTEIVNVAKHMQVFGSPLGIARYNKIDPYSIHVVEADCGINVRTEFGFRRIRHDDLDPSLVYTLTNGGVWNKVFDLQWLQENQITFADTSYAEDCALLMSTLSLTESVYLHRGVVYEYSDPACNPNSNDRKSNENWVDLFESLNQVWNVNASVEGNRRVIQSEALLTSIIGHIQYAVKKAGDACKEDVASNIMRSGFRWLSYRQEELKQWLALGQNDVNT